MLSHLKKKTSLRKGQKNRNVKPVFLEANNKNPKMDIQDLGGGGLKEGVGQLS